MMKSPMLSRSVVFVVVWSRPETDAPNILGEVEGEPGVVSTN